MLHLIAMTGTNWSAVSAITAIIVAVVALVGRVLGSKLNAIGDHLAAQDKAKEVFSDRLKAVETKVEMILRRQK